MGECLVKRCITESDICPICQREPETILHRLRDRVTSRQTWERLGIRPNSSFFEGSLCSWLEKNGKDHTCRWREQPPWNIIFPVVIWLLWKQRNETVFRNQQVQFNVHKDAIFRAFEFQHCGLNFKQAGNREVIRIGWEKFLAGWTCLNMMEQFFGA